MVHQDSDFQVHDDIDEFFRITDNDDEETVRKTIFFSTSDDLFHEKSEKMPYQLSKNCSTVMSSGPSSTTGSNYSR